MMTNTEVKPLTPLSHGSVLIVGTKASNFSDELKNHPRVIMWDSQNENWTSKSLPDNVRAVFLTRFISHASFANIIADARKRNITIFSPEGTGIIAKQVKELLNMQGPMPVAVPAPTPVVETVVDNSKGKLKPLLPFIDFTKPNVENARILFAKAKELGIQTSEASLAQLVGVQRRHASGVTGVPKSIQSKLDVSVEMLDNAIKDLSDMRDYLIATVEENRLLKTKLNKFKSLIED